MPASDTIKQPVARYQAVSIRRSIPQQLPCPVIPLAVARIGQMVFDPISPSLLLPHRSRNPAERPQHGQGQARLDPQNHVDELVAEMVCEDLKAAERDEPVKKHGYKPMDYHE